jgi:uncharacterized membrane protein YccC
VSEAGACWRNPERFVRGNYVNRLAGALIAYLVLGVLTWLTISDSRIRAATLAILALFAVKSWLRRKDVMHPNGGHDVK